MNSDCQVDFNWAYQLKLDGTDIAPKGEWCPPQRHQLQDDRTSAGVVPLLSTSSSMTAHAYDNPAADPFAYLSTLSACALRGLSVRCGPLA